MKNPNPLNWAEVERSFDEEFGKDGPEKDSDSIGHYAGCDDCAGNIKTRGEHKSFLHDKLLEAEKRGRNAAVDYIEKKAHIVKTVPISIEVYEQDLKAARESKGAESV